MPIVHLPDRSLLRISGADAEHFLQNLITADIDGLPEAVAKPSALLTPQGKILFDFLISRDGADAFRIDVRADLADELVRRLTLYRLRAKAEIAKQDQSSVAVAWQTDSSSSGIDSAWPEADADGRAVLRDLRFETIGVWRCYGPRPPASDERVLWDLLRIENGVAESGADYNAGDAFPHDVLLDQNGGVGFRKGCYVGQEVVSRMQHRGTARRRVLIVNAAAPLPASGAELTVEGRSVGTLGTVAGDSALAIARIDKVKEATDAGVPILADGVEVTLAIPPGVSFGLSEAAAADSA